MIVMRYITTAIKSSRHDRVGKLTGDICAVKAHNALTVGTEAEKINAAVPYDTLNYVNIGLKSFSDTLPNGGKPLVFFLSH